MTSSCPRRQCPWSNTPPAAARTPAPLVVLETTPPSRLPPLPLPTSHAPRSGESRTTAAMSTRQPTTLETGVVTSRNGEPRLEYQANRRNELTWSFADGRVCGAHAYPASRPPQVARRPRQPRKPRRSARAHHTNTAVSAAAAEAASTGGSGRKPRESRVPMKVSMATSASGPWSGTLAATARSAAAAIRPVAVQASRYGRTCPGAASGIPNSSGPERNDALAQPRPTPRMVTPATHKAWRHSGPGRRDASSPSELAQSSGLGRPGDSVTPRRTRPEGRKFPPESPTDAFASAEKHRRALGVEPVAHFVTPPPLAFRRFPFYARGAPMYLVKVEGQ